MAGGQTTYHKKNGGDFSDECPTAILGEPLWFCSTLVDALLTSELLAKSRGSPVPSPSSQLGGHLDVLMADLALDQTLIRPEHHGATLHYPFIWDEVDGTGEPRLLAGSSEASKASTSVEQNHKGSPRTAVGHSSEKSLRLRVVQHGGKDQKLFVKDTRRSA